MVSVRDRWRIAVEWGGYYNLLDAMKNPKHPEREDLLDWAGDYDPEAFDLEKINKQLARLELKG